LLSVFFPYSVLSMVAQGRMAISAHLLNQAFDCEAWRVSVSSRQILIHLHMHGKMTLTYMVTNLPEKNLLSGVLKGSI
jgi:hypothetical protein